MAKFFFALSGVFLSTKELFSWDMPDEYQYEKRKLHISTGAHLPKDECIKSLIENRYHFDQYLEKPGTYKAEGDAVTLRTLFDDRIVTISFFGNEVDGLFLFDSTTGEIRKSLSHLTIYGDF